MWQGGTVPGKTHTLTLAGSTPAPAIYYEKKGGGNDGN